VVEGMDVVNRLFAGYGEEAPFPKLDRVNRATMVAPSRR